MSKSILPQNSTHCNTGWLGPDLAEMDTAFSLAFDGKGSGHKLALALIVIVLPAVTLGCIALAVFGPGVF